MTLHGCRTRLAKLDAVLEAQHRFIYSVPDPDTRERAENHLYRLIEMRDEVSTIYAKLKVDGQGSLQAA